MGRGRGKASPTGIIMIQSIPLKKKFFGVLQHLRARRAEIEAEITVLAEGAEGKLKGNDAAKFLLFAGPLLKELDEICYYKNLIRKIQKQVPYEETATDEEVKEV